MTCLWTKLLDKPLYSMILVVLIDLFGFYSTYRKSYSKPYEEDWFRTP